MLSGNCIVNLVYLGELFMVIVLLCVLIIVEMIVRLSLVLLVWWDCDVLLWVNCLKILDCSVVGIFGLLLIICSMMCVGLVFKCVVMIVLGLVCMWVLVSRLVIIWCNCVVLFGMIIGLGGRLSVYW